MSKQLNFTDMEYAKRRKRTKREEFLRRMDQLIPWETWNKIVEPYYPEGKRGRPPQEIERMLRMTMLQTWFNLSDEGIEDAIYDSYAMRSFMGLDFNSEQTPDATTLCQFRKLLTTHNLQEQIFAQVQDLLVEAGMQVRGGTIVDATIVEASSSIRNKEKSRDPEMHSVKKGNRYYFGMREHIGVDPVHGFVNTIVSTPANTSEVTVTPKLVRKDDKVVYGDAGYIGIENYVTDGVKRKYKINLKIKNFKTNFNDSLAWQIEQEYERSKSSVRCKVEYVFHIVKDIFGWRKVHYKGIAKNHAHANLLFASANLFMLLNAV